MAESEIRMSQFVQRANTSNLSDQMDDDEEEREEERQNMLKNAFDISDSTYLSTHYPPDGGGGTSEDSDDGEDREHERELQQKKEEMYAGGAFDITESDEEEVVHPEVYGNSNQGYVSRAGDHGQLVNVPFNGYNQYNGGATVPNVDADSSRSEPSQSVTSAVEGDARNYNLKIPLSELNGNTEDQDRRYYNLNSSYGKENNQVFGGYNGGQMQNEYLESDKYKQLHQLYVTRGEQIDQLYEKIEQLEKGKTQEIYKLQHENICLKAENDASEKGRSELQILLSQNDSELKKMKTSSEKMCLEMEELKSLNNRFKLKVEHADSQIAMLEQTITDLKASDALTKSQKMHEDFLVRLKSKHNEDVSSLESKLKTLELQERCLKNKVTDLENKLKTKSVEFSSSLKEKTEEISILKSSVETYKMQCEVMLSSNSISTKEKTDALLKENDALKSEFQKLQKQFNQQQKDMEFYDNALKLQVFSHINTGDDSIVDLKLSGQKKLTYDDSIQAVEAPHHGTPPNEVAHLRTEHQRALNAMKQKRDHIAELETLLRNSAAEVKKYKSLLKSQTYDLDDLKKHNNELVRADAETSEASLAAINENAELKRQLKMISACVNRLDRLKTGRSSDFSGPSDVFMANLTDLTDDFCRIVTKQNTSSLDCHCGSSVINNLLKNQCINKLECILSSVTHLSLKISPIVSASDGKPFNDILAKLQAVCEEFQHLAETLASTTTQLFKKESNTGKKVSFHEEQKISEEKEAMKSQYEEKLSSLSNELIAAKEKCISVCKENCLLIDKLSFMQSTLNGQLVNSKTDKLDPSESTTGDVSTGEQKEKSVLLAPLTAVKNIIDNLGVENGNIKKDIDSLKNLLSTIDTGAEGGNSSADASTIETRSTELLLMKISHLEDNFTKLDSKYQSLKSDYDEKCVEGTELKTRNLFLEDKVVGIDDFERVMEELTDNLHQKETDLMEVERKHSKEKVAFSEAVTAAVSHNDDLLKQIVALQGELVSVREEGVRKRKQHQHWRSDVTQKYQRKLKEKLETTTQFYRTQYADRVAEFTEYVSSNRSALSSKITSILEVLRGLQCTTESRAQRQLCVSLLEALHSRVQMFGTVPPPPK